MGVILLSAVRLAYLCGLVAACSVLSHCAGDDSKKKLEASAGEGGAAGAGASTSGGSSTHPGGAPNPAGAAGEAAGSGNGGAAGTAGGAAGQTSAGAGGEAGTWGCSAAPNPASCCETTDVACDENWTAACYGDWNVQHFCCDAVEGVRHGCEYDGDFYTYSDQICLDPCTGKGFGTGSCADCLGNRAACDAGHCGVDQTACDNVVGGFSLSCTRGTEVNCVCDPELD